MVNILTFKKIKPHVLQSCRKMMKIEFLKNVKIFQRGFMQIKSSTIVSVYFKLNFYVFAQGCILFTNSDKS